MHRIIIAIVAVAAFAGYGIAEDQSPRLAERLFSSENLQLDMMKASLNPSQTQSGGETSSATSESTTKLNPGKALILSAILPGAGEYYAGSKIKAAIFFGLEVAAWSAVVYFYNAGQKKDKEFKDYANTHFTESIYRDREYFLALQPNWGDSGKFNGTLDEWISKGWDEKIHYLPSAGFTHNLPTQDERNRNAGEDQQYYEMIGKYIGQFGFGWSDVHQGRPTGPFWGDDPSTPWFDNQDPNYPNDPTKKTALLSIRYMDMRYESNQLLERSSIATQVALLNHVASAIDASLTVRAMNKQATATVGFKAIEFDGNPMAIGGLNLKW